jgi:hypothetical protein
MSARWRTDLSERDEKIVSMYEGGKTFQQIADLVGLTKGRVHQIVGPWVEVRHYGEERRKDRDLKIRTAFDRIVNDGSTVEKEAKVLGILPDTLAVNFRARDLKLPSTRVVKMHGTRYRYQRGCRCDECREALRIDMRKLRGKEPPHHGTPSAYFNYRCRCDPCRMAGSRYNRERRLERMKRLAKAS